MSASITLESVGLMRGARSVLADVSLQITAGEHVALLGPSGSGKTTLLRLVLGLESPSQGVIRVGDRVVSRGADVLVPPEERGLAVVFQDLALWPHLTVEENLAFGLQARGMSRDEQQKRSRAMLERLGLSDKERRHPGELSGGERQRVAVARALVLEPEAILLDEPLANLDVRLKRDLLRLFGELFAQQRCTVVYVTHDLGEAAALGNKIAVLEGGHVVQAGSLAELRACPSTEFVRALF